MSEWENDLRQIYRSYLTEELKRPEVQEAKAHLASRFAAPAVPLFEPAACLAACFLFALFIFLYQAQAPLRQVVLPETQPVMLALNPKPVLDAAPPSDLPQVLVKKVTSRVGTTMIYQRKDHDIPITVIWVFPGGKTQ